MKINWHDVITIVMTMIALGGAMMAALRGFFITRKSCEDTQVKCQASVCKKIDELKEDLKEDRNVIMSIKEDVALIKGALTK